MTLMRMLINHAVKEIVDASKYSTAIFFICYLGNERRYQKLFDSLFSYLKI